MNDLKNNKKIWLPVMVFFGSLIGLIIINLYFRPTGTIALYQKMTNADYKQFEKIIDDTYQSEFTEEDYVEMAKVFAEHANELSEYAIFKYEDKWMIINTSPDGKNKIRSIKIIDDKEIATLEKMMQ